jgi:hypothetical protein
VQFVLLPRILDQLGDSFYRVDRTWQPKDLIPDPYRRNLLKNAQEKYNQLTAAEDEFKALQRAHFYVQVLRRMRLTIKDAQFAWNFDDLKFLESIANFFTDYGILLRVLKEDEARGKLSPTTQQGI